MYHNRIKCRSGLPPATAKQQHRLASFSPEHINGRYSYRTETLRDVTATTYSC